MGIRCQAGRVSGDVPRTPATPLLHTALQAAGYPNRLLWGSGGHGAALTSGAVISAIIALAD